MRKVEFVRISSKISGYGLGKGVKYEFDEHREIILDRIKKGWDYNGYVPVQQRGTGDVEKIDLIFSKEEK